jgi:hypothetical protein
LEKISALAERGSEQDCNDCKKGDLKFLTSLQIQEAEKQEPRARAAWRAYFQVDAASIVKAVHEPP